MATELLETLEVASVSELRLGCLTPLGTNEEE
jgi:hypothetical protein